MQKKTIEKAKKQLLKAEESEEEEFGAVVEFDQAEDQRLRQEQDALTPTEQASYEAKLENLLAEDLDTMLEDIEGPEQPFEPHETKRPAQSKSPSSQPAGSDPAHNEPDVHMGQEIAAENSSTSDSEIVDPTYRSAKIAMLKKLTEIELASAKAKLEGVMDIRAERFLQTARTMQEMEEQDKANRKRDSEADKA